MGPSCPPPGRLPYPPSTFLRPLHHRCDRWRALLRASAAVQVTANVAAVLSNISTLDAAHERLRRSSVVPRSKAIVLGKQIDTPGRLRLMLALLIANIAGGRLEEAGAIEGEVEEEAEEVVGRGAAYDFVGALLNALQLSASEKCFLGQRHDVSLVMRCGGDGPDSRGRLPLCRRFDGMPWDACPSQPHCVGAGGRCATLRWAWARSLAPIARSDSSENAAPLPSSSTCCSRRVRPSSCMLSCHLRASSTHSRTNAGPCGNGDGRAGDARGTRSHSHFRSLLPLPLPLPLPSQPARCTPTGQGTLQPADQPWRVIRL